MKHTRTTIIVLLATLSMLSPAIYGAEHTKTKKYLTLKPLIAVETWQNVSVSAPVVSTTDRNAETFLRRFRVGASGQIVPRIKYSFSLHNDNYGKPEDTFTKGKNNGMDVWNAYVSAQVLKKSNALMLHAGYYWAAISREFNTSPWMVGSYDKARSNWYLRNFITGKTNGICSGIGLGGMHSFSSKLGINYRLGMHAPGYFQHEYSPLINGHVMVHFGDAEQSKYKFMLCGCQWGKRNGITLGFGGSYRNHNINTLQNTLEQYALGSDIAWHYKCFSAESEVFVMNEQGDDQHHFSGSEWLVRCTYCHHIKKGHVVPAIMYSSYHGNGDKELFSYTGNDETVDVGINYFTQKKNIKVGMHYLVMQGSLNKKIPNHVSLTMHFRI